MTERCDKFPSMEKRFCSHCQGQARGTTENPRFSITESFYKGNPVVAILKNGGQIHRFDEHFRFGCRKARLLLACMPAFKEFGWPNNAADRVLFKTRMFIEDVLHIRIEAYVTMNPNFVRSTGEVVEECWLDLREMPSFQVHKGVGVMKCKALWSVQDDLRAWVRRWC